MEVVRMIFSLLKCLLWYPAKFISDFYFITTNNFSLLARIFEYVQKWKSKDSRLVPKLLKYLQVLLCRLLENTLQDARKNEDDFTGLWNGQGASSLPVLVALYFRDVECLTILLRYGFPPVLSVTNAEMELRLFQEFLHSGVVGPNQTIMSLLLCSLQVLLHSQLPEDREEYQAVCHCLILLWRASSYTVWTLEDLENLCIAFEGEDYPEKFSDLITSLNGVDLPEIIATNRNPRTLKHIARCRVRKILQEAWKLPNGIEELNIPNELREYLDLRD